LPIEYTGLGGAATTGTLTVEDSDAVEPVTVMVRAVEFPPIDRVAVACPLASVVAWVTAIAPELALNATGTPDKALFDPSSASAVIVEVTEPSLSKSVTLLDKFREATAVVVAEEPETTWTCTVAVRPEAVAVTVMVLGVESPAVDRVAVAAPEELVVAVVTAMPPELAENDTSTPEIRLFDLLRARTVMVADWEPSDGMVLALLIAVRDDAVAPVPPPLLLLPPEELPPEELPPGPESVSLPPQAQSRAAAAHTNMIANLRIVLHPRSTLVGVPD
jgi:hypothetical protein